MAAVATHQRVAAPPMGSEHNSVGGGLGIRFAAAPAIGGANPATLIAVRNSLQEKPIRGLNHRREKLYLTNYDIGNGFHCSL